MYIGHFREKQKGKKCCFHYTSAPTVVGAEVVVKVVDESGLTIFPLRQLKPLPPEKQGFQFADSPFLVVTNTIISTHSNTRVYRRISYRR